MLAPTLSPLALILLTLPLAAQEVEFNRDIRPILSDKCYTCHGPSSVSRKTQLRFDIEGGANKVIVPGRADQSEMYRRISSENTAVRMPPAYAGRDKLTDKEIDTIRRWIDQGAKWQLLWSFIPPKRPAHGNDIDYFILSRLDREGLHPSP